ncbi:hypothetical protein JTB14_036906 [Gonioctena quinquepunctata]|nr:hypothetical protein JTB14_036906 [Gonioctena quinquepunctata]
MRSRRQGRTQEVGGRARLRNGVAGRTQERNCPPKSNDRSGPAREGGEPLQISCQPVTRKDVTGGQQWKSTNNKQEKEKIVAHTRQQTDPPPPELRESRTRHMQRADKKIANLLVSYAVFTDVRISESCVCVSGKIALNSKSFHRLHSI